jgi:hypothetical protein
MSEFDDAFSGLVGDATGAHLAVMQLGEAALARVQRRVDRLNERDGRSRGGVGLAEVATGIAMALRRGDQPGASALVAAAGQLFDHTALVTEIGLQAHQLERDALRAAQEPPRLRKNSDVHP